MPPASIWLRDIKKQNDEMFFEIHFVMNFPIWRLEEHIYKRKQQSSGSNHIEKVENMSTIAKFQWIDYMEAFGSYVFIDFACQISCESHKWP